MKAIEQDRADSRSDPRSGRSLQGQGKLAWIVTDAEEILADLAAGSEDHDDARMRELTGRGIVRETKAHRIGEGADLPGVSGQHPPAGRRGRRGDFSIAAEIGELFRER